MKRILILFFINVNSLNCNQSKLEKYFKDDNLGSTHLGENLGEKFFTKCARLLVKSRSSWWNAKSLGEIGFHQDKNYSRNIQHITLVYLKLGLDFLLKNLDFRVFGKQALSKKLGLLPKFVRHTFEKTSVYDTWSILYAVYYL